MSRSLNPRSAADPAIDGGPAGAPGGLQVSAGDIADEINDHLSCRRDALEADGVERTEAEQQARRSFGNVRRIARELFWIHHGERIMSQRVLWTAIVLVFVALMANLYFQLRSAAVMNEAILRLTEQMGRSQHPLAEARIKVVDEHGKPRPGVSVRVLGVNPSPYLSNATYTREFVSDADGLVRTGQIPLGIYNTEVTIPQNKENRARIIVSGPACRLLDDGKTEELTLTAPTLTNVAITFEPPEVAGWRMQDYFDVSSEARFTGTKVIVQSRPKFGESTQVPLLPSADLKINFQAESTESTGQRGRRSFNGRQTLARNDPRLIKDGTIRLELPSNETSVLTADGKIVSQHEASHQDVE